MRYFYNCNHTFSFDFLILKNYKEVIQTKCSFYSAVEIYDFKNDLVQFNRNAVTYNHHEFDAYAPLLIVDNHFCTLT